MQTRKILHFGHDHHGDSHHHHNHSHDHASHIANDSRSLLIAIGTTLSIFLVQLVGSYLTNSLALLSDSGHMFVDLASLIIAFVSLRVALRNDKQHKYTFGWRRIEILAALFNGIILLGICGVILFEVGEVLFGGEAHHVHTEGMIWVAAFGFVANAVALYFLHGSQHLTTRSAYLHVLTDLLSSGGVVLGGIVMHFSNAEWIDPAISVFITVFVGRSAYYLINKASVILMETVPDSISIAEVTQALCSLPGVVNVHDVHVWQIGSHHLASSAHIVASTTTNSDELLASMNSLLQQKFSINHSTFQIESSDYADSHDCSCGLHSNE